MIAHNIYGLSRSGNHAIIFWMIHNLVDEVQDIGHEIYIDKDRKLCYINNTGLYHRILKNNFPYDSFEYAIKSYEDRHFQTDTTIIILRDFLNLLCSRYQKYNRNKCNICLDNSYICDLYFLIQVWKQHSRSPKRIILYNEWLLSKSYRDKISKDKLNIENINDNIDYIPAIGDGSSFGKDFIIDKQSYLKRYELVDLPQHMKKIILEDQELLDINKNIFNIDIQKLLNYV
jgi:hypothetical protein